jgi:hypothetical protein
MTSSAIPTKIPENGRKTWDQPDIWRIPQLPDTEGLENHELTKRSSAGRTKLRSNEKNIRDERINPDLPKDRL